MNIIYVQLYMCITYEKFTQLKNLDSCPLCYNAMYSYKQANCHGFRKNCCFHINPYPTAFPYGNGMVLHFYQQQESSTTKTVHKVINKGLKTYV